MCKVITWNVKGLKSPQKRIKILRYLKCLGPDIVLLQETHLVEADFLRMQKLWVGRALGSSAVDGRSGVLTLIHKSFACKILSHEADEAGRLSLVHLEHNGNSYSIYNIYAPNNDNNYFFASLADTVQHSAGPFTILGGDLNSVVDPLLDRKSTLPSQLPTRSSDKINYGKVSHLSTYEMEVISEVDGWLPVVTHKKREYNRILIAQLKH
ncbi:uncharacterized protein LOC130284889 [Hyla sarda]|uniref:uncharacterized protein LOC130284889 n=1 Tax=Hyla sarda TaxID=327740 RepID=UPI0024C3E59A|nr:uncharacterized protein LOC130284889 [Hyla sarda]